MRIDIYVGEGAQVKPLSVGGMSALQRGVHVNLYGLHELPALGYTLDYQGLTDFNGMA